MAYQNLFEQLQETCDFIALEDDMAQIINALEKDLIEQGQTLPIVDVSGSILSTKKVMDDFLKEIQHSLIENPDDERLLGAEWAYKIAISQFHNRFSRYHG